MLYRNISIKKLRAKIVRKGIFTQLYYPSKKLEREHRLFRTVLDYALYDLTGSVKEKREEVYTWLNLEDIDFITVCLCAGLDPIKVYNMFLYFLTNFFDKILEEFNCFNKENSGILKTQTHKSSLSNQLKKAV